MIGKTNAQQGMPKKLRGTSYTFSYTGEVQEFTAPASGIYEIECSGAGSSANGSTAKARVKLRRNDKLYVYVGGQNNNFNGGGDGASASGNDANANMKSGCGASDVRTIKHTSGTWEGNESLLSRVVTAGGAGGSGSHNSAGDTAVYWTDENGYRWYRHEYVDTTTQSVSSSNAELSNNIIGKGSNATALINSFTQTYTDPEGSDTYTRYYASYDLSGGGGYYGGTNGKTGTSYVNPKANINGRSLCVSDPEYNKCNHTGQGSVVITCIK